MNSVPTVSFSRLAWRPAARVVLMLAAFLFTPPPAQAQVPPATPSSVTVTRADGTLTASGYAVSGATQYHITYTTDGGGSWHAPVNNHTNWTAGSITFAADNAKTYIVGVRAGNAAGWSGWRNSHPAGPFTPPPPPATPSSVSVTRSDGSLTAAWPAPANAAAYHVTYTVNGSGTWLLASLDHADNTIAISGVDNAKTYVVGVRARNSGGAWSGWRNSPAAGPFVPPTPTPTPTPALPERPTGLTATAGNGSVTLAWDAVSGAPGYEYSVRWAGVAWSDWTAIAGNAATATVDGLTNGTEYRFKLRAVNASGESKPAPAAAPWYVAATPEPPPPAAPSNVAVDPGEDSLDITWDAVSEATGYDVRAKAEGASDWHDVASGVTGTSYTYTTSETMDYVGVRARNANGASAWSDLSNLPPDDLMNVATGGGARSRSGVSAQSVQAQSQLAAPTWGTITRDIRRGALEGVGTISLNWTGNDAGATGYSIVCSPHSGWAWIPCGWDNNGRVTYTSVPSSQSQPVKVSHYRRTGAGAGDHQLLNSRSYRVYIRAVNATPSDASAWVATPTLRPVYPRLDDFTATRTADQITLSWTPNFWTTGYEVYCDTYTSGEASDYTLCATLTGQVDTAASHSVTITKSGGTHNWSALDDTSIIDIAIDSTNTWSRARWLPPLINPQPTLTASNIGVTVATLTISGHNGAWYYKADAAPDNTCKGPVNAGTSTKDLTGLSAHTAYTYTAYSDSACSTANELATATAFTTLSSVSNLTSTKAGDSDIGSKDAAVAFTTGTANTGGYVLKSVTLPLKILRTGTGDLVLTLHAMEGTGDYSSSSGPSDDILATLSGTAPTSSSWTDTTYTCSGDGCELDPGETYFVVAETSGTAQWKNAYATTETEVALPSGNGWSVGFGHYRTLRNWTSYSDWIPTEFTFAHAPSLTASNVTATGATLTIANHNGDWYYQANAAPDNTCKGPVSGSTKTLSGLTASTPYTYTAYSKTGCNSADELASVTFTTGASGNSQSSMTSRMTALLNPASAFTGGLPGRADSGAATGLPGYVSSLSSTQSGGTQLEAGDLAGVAFTTGPHPAGYTLDSVTATLAALKGEADLVWTLHEQAGDSPSPTARATLTGTAPTSDEFTDLTYTCAGDGCALAPDTTYFVVAESVGSGVVSWAFIFSSATLSETSVPAHNGWALGHGHYSADGVTWATFQDWQHTRLDFTPR